MFYNQIFMKAPALAVVVAVAVAVMRKKLKLSHKRNITFLLSVQLSLKTIESILNRGYITKGKIK